MPFSTHYRITADGGSKGNHDTNITSEAYGSYVLETTRNNRLVRLTFGEATSNEAEFRTVIGAVKDLQATILRANRQPKEFSVTIRMDSRLVVGGQGGYPGRKPWNIKAIHLVPLNAELKLLLSGFASVVWQKLPKMEIVAMLGH